MAGWTNGVANRTISCRGFVNKGLKEKVNLCYNGELLPNNDDDKMRWYWNTFAQDKKKGMTWEEF